MFVSTRSNGCNLKMSAVEYLTARSGSRDLLFGQILPSLETLINPLAGLAEEKRCDEFVCNVSPSSSAIFESFQQLKLNICL